MTANLDQALEPGETVIYRTRGRAYAGTVTYYGTLVLALALFAYFYAALRTPGPVDWDNAWFILSVGGGISIGVLVLVVGEIWGQRRTPDDLIITDRRLLFANSEWHDQLNSLELDQIVRLAWVLDSNMRYLTVEAPDLVIRLTPLRDLESAAKAIADAAGVPPAPALGRITAVDLLNLGFLPAALAAFLGLLLLFDILHLTAPGGSLGDGVWWLKLAILASAAAAALVLGVLIGGPLTLTILRPFITAKRAQAVICAGKREKWLTRIALKWASLLYRRPLPYVAC